jgi:hypothetical protein
MIKNCVLSFHSHVNNIFLISAFSHGVYLIFADDVSEFSVCSISRSRDKIEVIVNDCILVLYMNYCVQGGWNWVNDVVIQNIVYRGGGGVKERDGKWLICGRLRRR